MIQTELRVLRSAASLALQLRTKLALHRVALLLNPLHHRLMLVDLRLMPLNLRLVLFDILFGNLRLATSVWQPPFDILWPLVLDDITRPERACTPP